MANPYRHILSKLKALLIAENKLSVEEKQQQEWILVAKFHGVKITIGKGHVNTIFYQFGEKGKREVCYPDDIAERLEKMGKRRHWLYAIEKNDEQRLKTVWTEKAALKVEPDSGLQIVGLGEKREVLYRAKRTVRGFVWTDGKKAK